MTKPPPPKFTGFSQETLDFLSGLEANNNKPWFESHRGDYETHLLTPMRALVHELTELMLSIDPLLEVSPAVNKTISRIYRDTRFSRDKSLFRSNMWIAFKRPAKDWKICPAFFFELFPDRYRYGMGFYSATAATMRCFREMIDEQPKEFAKAIAFTKTDKRYEIAGAEYKRIIDPDKPKHIQTWYQKRDLCLLCNRRINKRLFGVKVLHELFDGFAMLRPIYQVLWKATDAAESASNSSGRPRPLSTL